MPCGPRASSDRVNGWPMERAVVRTDRPPAAPRHTQREEDAALSAPHGLALSVVVGALANVVRDSSRCVATRGAG
eukprot:7204534-Prymnesium_polylepis.1